MMKPQPKVSHPHFTPKQLETVTGASLALVRNWRKRGHISKHVGDKNADGFSVDALVGIFVLKRMSDIGIGPAAIGWRITTLADRVFSFAVDDRHVWDDDTAYYESEEAGRRSSDRGRFAVVRNNGQHIDIVEDLNATADLLNNRAAQPFLVVDCRALGRELAQLLVENDLILMKLEGWIGQVPDKSAGEIIDE